MVGATRWPQARASGNTLVEMEGLLQQRPMIHSGIMMVRILRAAVEKQPVYGRSVGRRNMGRIRELKKCHALRRGSGVQARPWYRAIARSEQQDRFRGGGHTTVRSRLGRTPVPEAPALRHEVPGLPLRHAFLSRFTGKGSTKAMRTRCSSS
jgi:hypothetical protein